jgi:hypothetical protein
VDDGKIALRAPYHQPGSYHSRSEKIWGFKICAGTQSQRRKSWTAERMFRPGEEPHCLDRRTFDERAYHERCLHLKLADCGQAGEEGRVFGGMQERTKKVR